MSINNRNSRQNLTLAYDVAIKIQELHSIQLRQLRTPTVSEAQTVRTEIRMY